MNPMLQEALASILRSILKIGAGYLVAKGVWESGDAATYVSAAALALVGVGWSLWTLYQGRLKLLTALASASPHTEQAIERKIARQEPVPSVTTPPDIVPVPVPAKSKE